MIIDVPAHAAGTRICCYCKDCQTAARLHDPEQDILSPAGASNVWHTTPDLVTFESGVECLKISRLSPRGAYRWYAGCCGSLMFSTIRNLNIPFISVTLRLPELAECDPLLGPVRCHAFTSSAPDHPDAPGSDKGMRRAGLLALKRALLAWLSGQSRRSPLRRPDGTPIAGVEVISLEKRKAAMPEYLT